MAVFHILKDGSRIPSVAGLVVKFEDAERVYQILNNINKRLAKNGRCVFKEEQHGSR